MRKINQARRLNRGERLSQEGRNRKSMKQILGLNKRAEKKGAETTKKDKGRILKEKSRTREGRT